MVDYRVLGAVFLIASTTLGAGMLALPFAFNSLGFLSGTVLLFSAWFVMLYGGVLLMDLSCHVFGSRNIYASVGSVAGKWAQYCISILFLILFYSLISAYLAAGSDILGSHFIHGDFNFYSASIFVFVFLTLTAPVFLGVGSVDFCIRILFIIKILAFILFVFLLFPSIKYQVLFYDHPLDSFQVLDRLNNSTWSLALSSFGFHICIPFLVKYLNSSKKKLYIVLFFGTIIPLLIYVLWLVSVFGLFTPESLMLVKDNIDSLIQALALEARAPTVKFLLYLFADVALISSFVAVSMGLFDFLDSLTWFDLNLDKSKKKWLIYFATFFPPLLFNRLVPDGFVWFLSLSAIPLLGLTLVLPMCLSHLCQGFSNQVFYGKYLPFMNMFVLVLMFLLGAASMTL